jgi:hypothetical protein
MVASGAVPGRIEVNLGRSRAVLLVIGKIALPGSALATGQFRLVPAEIGLVNQLDVGSHGNAS